MLGSSCSDNCLFLLLNALTHSSILRWRSAIGLVPRPANPPLVIAIAWLQSPHVHLGRATSHACVHDAGIFDSNEPERATTCQTASNILWVLNFSHVQILATFSHVQSLVNNLQKHLLHTVLSTSRVSLWRCCVLLCCWLCSGVLVFSSACLCFKKTQQTPFQFWVWNNLCLRRC